MKPRLSSSWQGTIGVRGFLFLARTFCAIRRIGLRAIGRQWSLLLDAFIFDDGVNEVGWQVFERFLLAARPQDLNTVHHRFHPEAEVESEIILRKIAGTGADFIELHQFTGIDCYARTDCGLIALGAH